MNSPFSGQKGDSKQSADKVCRIKETLPREVTEKMHAPEQDTSIPFVTPDVMTQYDAFVSSHSLYLCTTDATASGGLQSTIFTTEQPSQVSRHETDFSSCSASQPAMASTPHSGRPSSTSWASSGCQEPSTANTSASSSPPRPLAAGRRPPPSPLSPPGFTRA